MFYVQNVPVPLNLGTNIQIRVQFTHNTSLGYYFKVIISRFSCSEIKVTELPSKTDFYSVRLRHIQTRCIPISVDLILVQGVSK